MDFMERKRKVEHLLRVKFPFSWSPPPITPLRGPPAGLGQDEMHKRLMVKVGEERALLMALPDEELEQRFVVSGTEEQAKAAMRAAIEEKGRFFSKREAEADFGYWAKVEYWTLDESIALLLGKSPEVVTWKAIQAFVNISAFAKHYERLRNLALRAQAMNRGQTTSYPSAVLAWAAEMEIPVPTGLQDAMAERQAKRLAAAAGRDEVKPAHNPYLGGGSLDAFKAQAPQAATPAPQFPSSPARPIEYIHILKVESGQKLFALADIPTMTAHAIQQEAFGGPRDDSVPEERLLFATTVLTHKEQLRNAVLAGAVTPFSRGPMTPAPRQWNDDPRAGYVLPIGELRKFADHLLMEVKAESPEAPAAQEPEAAPEAAEANAEAFVVHTLATRRDVLDPVIDLAVRNATSPTDHAAVWNAFTGLADSKDPPDPLISFREGEVLYRGVDGSTGINRAAFLKRMKRRAEKRR